MEEQEEKKPLIEVVEELKKQVDVISPKEKDKKKKVWRLPFKAKVGRKKARQNWVGIIVLNENRHINALKSKIDEGVITDKEGNPHLATSDYIWYWKKKPVVIVPGWSTEPISASSLKEKADRDGTNVTGNKLLLNWLEKGELKEKKKFGFAPIIILAILGAIGYFMYKSGAFS